MVSEGLGYYQKKGSPIRWMRKGEVIKCPHHVQHWHGAPPKTSVTHIAISTNTQVGEVKWSGHTGRIWDGVRIVEGSG